LPLLLRPPLLQLAWLATLARQGARQRTRGGPARAAHRQATQGQLQRHSPALACAGARRLLQNLRRRARARAHAAHVTSTRASRVARWSRRPRACPGRRTAGSRSGAPGPAGPPHGWRQRRACVQGRVHASGARAQPTNTHQRDVVSRTTRGAAPPRHTPVHHLARPGLVVQDGLHAAAGGHALGEQRQHDVHAEGLASLCACSCVRACVRVCSDAARARMYTHDECSCTHQARALSSRWRVPPCMAP
jgi:hypothetical protein